MSLQERKKLAISAFQRLMRELTLAGQTKVVGNKAAVTYPDGTNAVMQLLMIRGGLGVGEFAAYTTLGIHGGTVYDVLKATKLDGGGSYPKDLIVQGTSHELVPTLRRGAYAFRESTDVEQLIGKAVKDIQRFYVPLVEAFAGGYREAAEFVLSTGGAHVRKPFCMGVVLFCLAGSCNQLDQLIARAKEDKSFWDYHKAKDPGAIITRVGKWMDAHALGASAKSR